MHLYLLDCYVLMGKQWKYLPRNNRFYGYVKPITEEQYDTLLENERRKLDPLTCRFELFKLERVEF